MIADWAAAFEKIQAHTGDIGFSSQSASFSHSISHVSAPGYGCRAVRMMQPRLNVELMDESCSQS